MCGAEGAVGIPSGSAWRPLATEWCSGGGRHPAPRAVELALADSYTSKSIRFLHFHGRKAGRPTERPGPQNPGWSRVSSSSLVCIVAVVLA